MLTTFGERAFSHAGPATWNALPDHIRTVADPVKFRKLLKSHYLSQAFNIRWFLFFFLGVLAFGWLLYCTHSLGSLGNGRTINFWYDMIYDMKLYVDSMALDTAADHNRLPIRVDPQSGPQTRPTWLPISWRRMDQFAWFLAHFNVIRYDTRC